MQTTYKEHLVFTEQMEGYADIITEERRVITHFIDPLKYIWENNINN
ncbi:MAG: hypothetical protein HC831_01760 [Chloroflexia bacterium]|nr:hypothetical protein [Chloroflexia bacterium]